MNEDKASWIALVCAVVFVFAVAFFSSLAYGSDWKEIREELLENDVIPCFVVIRVMKGDDPRKVLESRIFRKLMEETAHLTMMQVDILIEGGFSEKERMALYDEALAGCVRESVNELL